MMNDISEPIVYRIKDASVRIGLHIILIGVSLFCLFPVVWMFSSSLKTQETVFRDFRIIPKELHLENFYIAWTKGEFGVYFFNSLFYTVSVVCGVVLISSLAAYAFSRLKFKGSTFLYYLLLSSMMVPIPGSFIALYVLLTKLNLIDTRLGYILPQINGGLALGIFLLKTFFDKIPRDLEDSAKIDGCTKLGIYRHIAMPLAKPAIAVLVIFTTLVVWNEFLLAMLIFSDKNLMPLQRGLMVFQGAHITQYPILMAGMLITIIPVIVIYLIMHKYIISGIMAGAIKA